jgi:biopolymer transport protein ExbD
VASTSYNADEPITGINVTPLVDITLVLLIVFMVTAQLIAGQGVPLDLPEAATAGATESVLTLSIDAAGNLLVNGEPVSDRETLRARARQAHSDNPAIRSLVAASAQVTHGRVLEIIDTLREAGVTRVAFAAEPLKGEGRR